MLALLVCLLAPALAEDAPEKLLPAESAKETKWLRDSLEYWTITRQVYRQATDAVITQAAALKKKEAWAVVLDADETCLDNSPYQLERHAYGLGFDWTSWNAWTERRAAQAIPGAVGFVDAVRAAGGRVAFVSNRYVGTADATADNLRATGLMKDGDLLCLLDDMAKSDKSPRRGQIRGGAGACSWAGTPVTVLAWMGDTMTDFPEQDEDNVGTVRDELFGERYFILPNPMYGSWEKRVTRPLE